VPPRPVPKTSITTKGRVISVGSDRGDDNRGPAHYVMATDRRAMTGLGKHELGGFQCKRVDRPRSAKRCQSAMRRAVRNVVTTPLAVRGRQLDAS
jgi:hypothetical protein